MLKKRFEKKFIKHKNGCWQWVASTNNNGYGKINVGGAMKLAHRVSYELYVGPIPHGSGYHGTCVLHKCDNRLCVNPDHLFLGTQEDNLLDMSKKNRFRALIGEKHGMSKLTEQDVLNIRGDNRASVAIGRDYSVCSSLIRAIKRRELWAHV